MQSLCSVKEAQVVVVVKRPVINEGPGVVPHFQGADIVLRNELDLGSVAIK